MVNLDAIIEAAKVISAQVWGRIIEIVQAPAHNPEMFWILGPLIAAMLLMSFYFGRYKKEELGWNTAFGNSMVLIFTCVDLVRYLYNQGILFQFNVQNALVLALIFEGFLLTLLNFYHLVPKSFAFGMSSGLTINVTVLFIIVLIYSKLPLDYITAIACTLMSVMIISIVSVMQFLESEAPDDGEG